MAVPPEDVEDALAEEAGAFAVDNDTLQVDRPSRTQEGDPAKAKPPHSNKVTLGYHDVPHGALRHGFQPCQPLRGSACLGRREGRLRDLRVDSDGIPCRCTASRKAQALCSNQLSGAGQAVKTPGVIPGGCTLLTHPLRTYDKGGPHLHALQANLPFLRQLRGDSEHRHS